MATNKRLLLVTYSFPPEPLPGSLRPGYLARYLPQCGWDVTVLTHSHHEPPFDATIVRAGVRAEPTRAQLVSERARAALGQGSALRTLLRTIKEGVAFPDELAAWIPPAVAAGARLLRREKFDAILTTALPTSVHVAGAALSWLSGVPWVADYRDLWSGNPYMPWGPLKIRAELLLERLTIARAARLTTVSAALARSLRQLHGKDVDVIENAYDPAEWDGVPDDAPSGFDLVFTGTMYGGKRSPDLLLRALARLREEGHPLAQAARVHFYGKNNEHMVLLAARHGLREGVIVHGMVPRTQALRAQRASAALLVFLSMDPQTANETGSKYLEYLGARRPMIVFGPENSVMREVMGRLQAGYFVSDEQQAVQALRAVYEAFTRGEVRVTPNDAAAPTAAELARRFAASLERALSRVPGTPVLHQVPKEQDAV